MRKLILIFLVVVMYSCQKEEEAAPGLRNNIFTAEKNSKAWGGVTEIRLDTETDTLTILSVANRPNDEVLVMKVKFQGEGQYPLRKKQAYYYSTVGGDVAVSEYKLPADATGQLNITHYDPAKKWLVGTFALDLNKTWSYTPDYPEVLSLTKGNWKGEIVEE